MEPISFFEEFFANASPVFIFVVVVISLIFWFLPAILAYFFNRKHAKLITAACVPAGISFIAWSGLIVWAVTGKGIEKYMKKKTEKEQVKTTS